MVNEHMHAVVRCPWGCMDYYHKVDNFCMMSVYHQYLGSSLVTLGNMKSQALSSTRDNYIMVKDRVLFNPAWEIVPLFAFIAATGPTVLVCHTHGSSSNVKYIHPPLHPGGNVPAARADQMAQAVVVPQTIVPMKVKHYSNAFQMHEMHGSFAGISTTDIADKGRYDFPSVLTGEKSELTALVGRMDMNGLLARQGALGVIPQWLCELMVRDASQLGNSEAHNALYVGATYVSYIDAICMQGCLDHVTAIMIANDHVDEEEVEQIVIQPSWLLELCWTHPCDQYGAVFSTVPTYDKIKNIDTRYLWFTISMLAMVPSLWRTTVNSMDRMSNWLGWVLTLATGDCFKAIYCRGQTSNKNPFGGVLKAEVVEKQLAGSAHGEYDSNVMFGILAVIRDVHILWANELLGSGEVPNVVVLHDVIVVLRHSGDQDYQLPDVYCDSTDCREWELCYAAVSNIGGLLHTWTGDAYFWHGRAFPFWWHQSHNNAGCVKHRETTLELVITGWNVKVYVQNKPADFEGLHNNYLQYIGGQKKNICARHDVPLIAIVGDRKTVCVCIASVNPDLYPPFPEEYLCCKWSLLCCPIQDCKVGICKQHAVSSSGLCMELHPISWDARSIASGEVGNSLDNLVVVIEGMDLVRNGGVVAYDSLRSIPSSTDGSGTSSKADGLLALDPEQYPSSDMLHNGMLNVDSAIDRLPSLHSGGANTNSSSPLVDLSRVPSGTGSSDNDINYLLSSGSIEDSMEANRLGGNA